MPSVAELRKKAHHHYEMSMYNTELYLLQAIKARESIPEDEMNDADFLALSIYYFDLADCNDRSKKFELWRYRSDEYRAKIKSFESLDLTGYEKEFCSTQTFLNRDQHEQYLIKHRAHLANKTVQKNITELTLVTNPLLLLADEAIDTCQLLQKTTLKMSDKEALAMHDTILQRLMRVKKILIEQKQDAVSPQRISKIEQLITSTQTQKSVLVRKPNLFAKPAAASAGTFSVNVRLT